MLIRLSLQERVIVLVIAAILPLSALSLWFAWRATDAATEAAQSQLKFAASLVAAGQDRSIESAQHLLGAIAAMPEMRSGPRSTCEGYFRRLRASYPMYANIGILDLQGNVVCHANGSPGSFNAADRPYFQQALAQRRFVMGEVIVGRASGQRVVPFAEPLFDGDHLSGVAFAALDLAHVTGTLARTELPPGSRVLVIDRRGLVLMEHPPQPGDPRTLVNPDALRAARNLPSHAGVGIGPDRAGVQRIFAFDSTRRIGDEGWLAAVSVERDRVTGSPLVLLAGQMAQLGATLLVGMAAAWWIGRRMIVRPARQILSVVRQLEHGRLDARVKSDGHGARGEFARIGAAFNLMAESLEHRQRELETELNRSRGAYEVLDLVLNSMQEGLVAVDAQGRFLLFNEAARRMFPVDGTPVPSSEWARRFGLYHADGKTRYAAQDVSLARAMRGETGSRQAVFARNERIPEGRMLQCSYQPMRGPAGASGGLVVFWDVTQQQKVETDLVLLRNAVARLNDIVLITEADPLDEPGPRIVFVNEAFERLTGYTAKEAIGKTPRMLQGLGTDRLALGRIREALSQGLPVREELVNYTKDGREIWLEMDIVPMGEGRGNYTHLIAVQRDITARKKTEDALRERERELREFTAKLQRAAEATQAIAGHHTPEATMQEVVDRAREVIGAHQCVLSLTRGDGAAQIVTALSLSEKYEAWRHRMAAPDGSGIYSVVVETGRALRLTHEDLLAHPRWNGFGEAADSHPPLRGLLAVPMVDRQGRIAGLLQLSDKLEGEFGEDDEYVARELAQLAAVALESARLFTEIRLLNAGLETRIAERTAELTRQEQLYRTLAEQAPEVVWNVDPHGRVTFLNHAWTELVGGETEQWLGFKWRARMHPDDLPDIEQRWLEASRTGQPYSGIRRTLAKDGSWHTMSYRGAPVLDEDGRVVSWVGIDTDITEFKAIEAALRSSNQELEAFSYSVSHDLRAPLGAIGGFTRALSMKLGDGIDDRSKHFLARIQAGVDKMEQLIEALLTLARVVRAPLNYVPVDLSAIARDTLEGLQMQHPERRVQVQVEDGLMVQGDARLLRAVMENLLGNAWKFTGGRDDARIEVGRLEGSSVFFVRDNGVGFDMAYAGKLFGAFQRLHTEAEFPGTGVGLATVRRVIARHQGRVWGESRPGEGTTFFFTLAESAPPTWLLAGTKTDSPAA